MVSMCINTVIGKVPECSGHRTPPSIASSLLINKCLRPPVYVSPPQQGKCTFLIIHNYVLIILFRLLCRLSGLSMCMIIQEKIRLNYPKKIRSGSYIRSRLGSSSHTRIQPVPLNYSTIGNDRVYFVLTCAFSKLSS
jgi:hypothetical protein